jgi:hypothetical protein
MMPLTQNQHRKVASKDWLIGPITLLCLPSVFFGILWLAYQVYDAETKTAYNKSFAAFMFFFYLLVSTLGIYLWGLAVVFWVILLASRVSVRITKILATILLCLALLGTFKAGWVLGFRH